MAVLSGISFALLGMAAVLSARALLGLDVRRHLIQAVSAGDQLIVKLELENQNNPRLCCKSKTCPFVLGQSVQAPIEIIPPSELPVDLLLPHSTSGCLPLAALRTATH